MKVPYQDLSLSSPRERQALLDAIGAVMERGHQMMGPEIEELEGAVARRIGRGHAVMVGSGTAALELALRALGIRPGDEVITTPLTTPSTVNAIRLTGAVPVFGDVGPDLNLDPASVVPLITERTRALLPVHWSGRLCDMDGFWDIARERNLGVIEDGSRAFGGERLGHKSGGTGEIGCFSFNPTKVFAACGEAGMALTDDDGVAERLRLLRLGGHACPQATEPSPNARPDSLQAAILLKRLQQVDGILRIREENARLLDEALDGLVTLPPSEHGERHVYQAYTILTEADRRDALKAHLAAAGIDARIDPPTLVPDLPAHRENARGDWLHARDLHRRMLSLPIHEKLEEEQVERMADAVRAFFRSA